MGFNAMIYLVRNDLATVTGQRNVIDISLSVVDLQIGRAHV